MSRAAHHLGRGLILGFAALSTAALSAPPAPAGDLAIRDSFRIGSGGVLCTAQSRPLDAEAKGMFDRAYAIVCRDAAAEVGKLYALRGDAATAGAMIARRSADLDCAKPVPASVEGLAGAQRAECTRRDDGLPYRIYSIARGDTVFVGEGLRGYDSAVALGFRSLVANRPVIGIVDVAVTQAGDPAAFARIQAGLLDSHGAMTEGYLRNNAGSFAESAAFFSSLVETSASDDKDSAEYLLNAGLQQSNLGNRPSAELAFRQADLRGAARDPVLGRMLRNYRAMALLNNHDAKGAYAAASRPVAPVPEAIDQQLADGVITRGLADRINRGDAGARRLGAIDGKLRPWERAQILDGQAALLRGSAERLQGHQRDALASFAEARGLLLGVRGGKVASAGFLQSEVLAESALAEESLGQFGGADRDFVAATKLVDINYPRSAAGLIAKARLAAYRARRGDKDGARTLYAGVVADSADTPGGAAPMRDLLRPYFALLASRDDKGAAADMFAASQVLIRPGLAQTQAVMARELSGGNDEAARLFRDALDRSRDVTRASGDVAQLAAGDPPDGSRDALALTQARDRLMALQREQVSLQARLAQYPRYRVLDTQRLSLADLQKALRPREAYYAMRAVGSDAYAVFVTAGDARAFKIDASADSLGSDVAALRDSIVRIDNHHFVTEPFKLALARRLYDELFGPVGDAMKDVDHLIYEPDGALLELPANLLVTDQASVDRYNARAATKPFDFTGIAWLGRARDVTTSVSPRAFIDVRNAPASHAVRTYIGLGHNAPPNLMATFLAVDPPPRSVDRCSWPVSAWQNPINASELYAARDALGVNRSTIVTDGDFSDTGIAARQDMASYRVVHFATHGLVTAPRPECPARPALLTSFGPGKSDGLLTFREIYDLRLDADLVILSACDTAGMATIDATRDAGVETGGNFALDGLVRAFVAAGTRSVVASHWPVPDDYDATERLVIGMIAAPPGTPIATALRRAETALMDKPATSHPYYWAAFALVGDGERPITAAR